MKHSFLRNITLSLSIALAASMAAPVSAGAAALPDQKQLVNLKKNKVYTQYDVTGDGREDTFRYALQNEGKKNCILTVTVNGKTAFMANDSYSYKLKLCTLKNGRVFLNVSHEFDDASWQKQNCLYQYKKGKMTRLTSIVDYPDKRYQIQRGDVTQVTGNDIVVSYNGLNNVVGVLNWKGIYRYESSSRNFLRTANTMKVDYTNNSHSNSWKISSPFHVYTTTKCKTKAFRLKKGEVVQINRINSTEQKFCLELVRANGTKGWISSPRNFQGMTQYVTNPNFISES